MYFDMELKPAERPALQTDTGICITYGELREQIAEFRHAVRQLQLCFFIMWKYTGSGDRIFGLLKCRGSTAAAKHRAGWSTAAGNVWAVSTGVCMDAEEKGRGMETMQFIRKTE